MPAKISQPAPVSWASQPAPFHGVDHGVIDDGRTGGWTQVRVKSEALVFECVSLGSLEKIWVTADVSMLLTVVLTMKTSYHLS